MQRVSRWMWVLDPDPYLNDTAKLVEVVTQFELDIRLTYPGGIFGGCSRSHGLHSGHGAPAPPQLHASHGRSRWSSHTQRDPRHMSHCSISKAPPRGAIPNPVLSGSMLRKATALFLSLPQD